MFQFTLEKNNLLCKKEKKITCCAKKRKNNLSQGKIPAPPPEYQIIHPLCLLFCSLINCKITKSTVKYDISTMIEGILGSLVAITGKAQNI